MKVVVFNVKYSPNLGDGLLSECLEQALRHAQPDMTVSSADLAGRTDYGLGSKWRGRVLTILEALPTPIRRLFARVLLETLIRLRIRPTMAAALEQCDAVVIGGGNLFADTDLNFPMKISAALAETAVRDLPVAVFGVGATRNWSPTGHQMLANALAKANLVDATLRDERSVAIWDDYLVPHGIRKSSLACDPGLLASRYFASGKRSETGNRVGLCITDPVALRYHGGDDAVGNYIGQWYGQVISRFAAAGYDVQLFTNGSPEDRAYLDANAEAWARVPSGSVTIIPGFADPAALTLFLSSCDLIVAHRMHACIAAHSFAIPTIGLHWDVKLQSFFAIAGRPEFVADPKDVTPDAMVALAARALAEGVEPVAHAALLDRSASDVQRLAALLSAAPRSRR